jgi:hypothetical protein
MIPVFSMSWASRVVLLPGGGAEIQDQFPGFRLQCESGQHRREGLTVDVAQSKLREFPGVADILDSEHHVDGSVHRHGNPTALQAPGCFCR